MEIDNEEDRIDIDWTTFYSLPPFYSEIDQALDIPLYGHESIMASIEQEKENKEVLDSKEKEEKLFLLQPSSTNPLTYNTNLIFTFPIDMIPNFHFFFS